MKHDPALTNHRLTVAYRGTGFEGWQRQGDKPTVQLAIEQALAAIWGEPVTLHGSGRTDSGVHALAQVANFEARKKLAPAVLVRALNDHLPDPIRITKAAFARPEFHARFDSAGKEYHYRIDNDPSGSPFLLDLAWHLPRPLDAGAMQAAATHLLGTHNFSSFASNPGYERETMVRTITCSEVKRKKQEVVFIVRGDGFLYRMVRNLVGALVKVGHGKMTPDGFKKILEAQSRQAAPNTAPAGGLYMAKVFYGTLP
jgi:tRNA pseudouridine38-40 synthase